MRLRDLCGVTTRCTWKSNLNKRIPKFEWMQLLALAGVHFLVDMFGNMLPSILPVIREEFALSLSLGGFVLASLTLTSNFVQVLTGHMRAEKTKPLFLQLGLVLAAGICLLSVLPRSSSSISLVILFGIISGCGIAIAHPEGLRAIHCLTQIPPAISTAVFMTGGFLGFSCGGAISAGLVSRFGLGGLCPLILCSAVGVLMVILLKIRLSVGREESCAEQAGYTVGVRLHFLHVMIMALPAAISSTVVLLLLPTRLNELGFELTFGGFSSMIFGLGGTLGVFIWAAIAQKKGELPCSILAFLLAVPLLVVYLALLERRMAVWILFGLGFCAMSGYVLIVTIARYAIGLRLGQRMGFIVGGSWGLAIVVFMALTPAAERYGTHLILKFMPLGYLFSGAFGFYIMLKNTRGNRHRNGSSTDEA